MTGALDEIQDETMTVLSKLLVPGQAVALVDFPNHENSGDSLIYLGELRYLERLGVSLNYVADQSRYNPEHLRRMVPHGPILIHGGGNFGDRWLDFQEMRERVIRDFPDRAIIQLSQGIEFSEGPRLELAQSVLNAHNSLTLLIRDHAGVARTKALFPNASVLFCPDMAFGYGKVERADGPRVDLVIIRREDSESTQGKRKFKANSTTTVLDVDWGLRGVAKAKSRVLHIPGAIVKRIPALASRTQPTLQACYRAQAQNNVDHAVRILSRGHFVATDRLHATVLAALIGIPVIAMDNANGKISAIIRDYLGRLPGVTYAPDVETAEAIVDEMSR
jgi:exopolysaccharide biosynthesis predicted pyruvyltransferase EpsI